MVADTVLYDRLNIKPTATQDEIRLAYKALALKYHPDKNPNDYNSLEAFKKIAAAYDILSDPARRAQYDKFGMTPFNMNNGDDDAKPPPTTPQSDEKDKEDSIKNRIAIIQGDIEAADKWEQEKMENEKPVRMNLIELSKADSDAGQNVEYFFNTIVNFWVQESNTYPMTVLGRKMYEWWLVKQMNLWFGSIDLFGKESTIVVRTKSQGIFKFIQKSISGFRQMFEGREVSTYNRDTYNRFKYLSKNSTDVGASLPITKDGRLKVKNENKIISIADIWLKHPRRAVYSRIVFNPTPANFPDAPKSDELNMWGGFRLPYEKVKKFTNYKLLWPLMCHIRYTLCDNDDEFSFLLGHFACVLQQPWNKQGMIAIFQGPSKTGKTMLFLLLGDIIGERHFVHLQNVEDSVGNFNTPSQNMCYVFQDEVHGSSHKEANILKNDITGRTKRKRGMYADAYYELDFTNYGAASNDDWCFTASNEERRALILLSTTKYLLGNSSYKECLFNLDKTWRNLYHHKDLKEEKDSTPSAKFIRGAEEKRPLSDIHFSTIMWTMKDNKETGLKTFANFLYKLPLRNYNPKSLPATKGLAQQKYHSLSAVQKWWLDCLVRGFIKHENGPKGEVTGRWFPNYQLIDVQHIFTDECVESKRQKMSLVKFMQNWSKCLPPQAERYQMELGANRKAEAIALPELSICRTHFNIVVPGIEYYWNQSAAGQAEKNPDRTAGANFTNLYCWAPNSFFGWNLKAALNSRTYKNREPEDSFDPIKNTINEPPADIKLNFMRNFMNEDLTGPEEEEDSDEDDDEEETDMSS